MHSFTRRRFLGLLGVLWVGSSAVSGTSLAINRQADLENDLESRFKDLEGRLAARLGAVIIDTHTGRKWQRRADERFPMCSVFKVLACGALLRRVDAGQEDLDRRLYIEPDDLVTYSPVTEHRVGGEGMTLGDICAAAMTQSDNTAANLVLKCLGGPGEVTEFARSLGDTQTRLDRWETELNAATPGDIRDTTTPAAMAHSLNMLFLKESLSSHSQAQLTAWFVANQTGDAKLRAGLPQGWRVGDRTGGGAYGTMNNIAVIWSPGRQPLIASVFITETEASFDDRNAAIASIGRALTELLLSPQGIG